MTTRSFQQPNPMLAAARQALRARLPEEAERLARAVLKARPRDLAATEILGRALLIRKQADAAIALLHKAAQRTEDPAIETLLAKALAAAERQDDAIALLRNTTARRPPFAPAFLELAQQLREARLFAEASAVLEDGIALGDDADDLKMALGHLHLARGVLGKARALFAAVREAAPGRHDALIAFARVLMLDGEHAGAVELYRRALGLKPDDPLTRINLGKCLLEMGAREAGEAALKAAARGGKPLTGLALVALAGAPRGRMFLRPADAARFFR